MPKWLQSMATAGGGSNFGGGRRREGMSRDFRGGQPGFGAAGTTVNLCCSCARCVADHPLALLQAAAAAAAAAAAVVVVVVVVVVVAA